MNDIVYIVLGCRSLHLSTLRVSLFSFLSAREEKHKILKVKIKNIEIYVIPYIFKQNLSHRKMMIDIEKQG